MFIEIDNSPRNYAWGSVHAIADLRGVQPSGAPEAELWLGAHPGSPSRIVDPRDTGGAADLAAWIAADPRSALGDALTLPFLMKVLAAQTPLSIQVHPSPQQARSGYARENAQGIPIDAANRNYRDDSHKPELIFCLSETFHALWGIRKISDTVSVLHSFIQAGQTAKLPTEEIEWLVTLVDAHHDDVRDALGLLLEPQRSRSRDLAAQLVAIAATITPGSALAGEADTIRLLGSAYPGDPGIGVALLMNRVELRRGDVLYVPHGVLHAYLSGLGMEIMASSDNVLRGGLTSKHVDVTELLTVGVFEPGNPIIMPGEAVMNGVTRYSPGVPEFELLHVGVPDDSSSVTIDTHGPAIAFCVNGDARFVGRHSSIVVRRGMAVFLTPDEGLVTIEGHAELFFALTGH
ncbi:MAG: mannose-6-phosphate isomerase, class I [Microbacteriaceae bacterium]